MSSIKLEVWDAVLSRAMYGRSFTIEKLPFRPSEHHHVRRTLKEIEELGYVQRESDRYKMWHPGINFPSAPQEEATDGEDKNEQCSECQNELTYPARLNRSIKGRVGHTSVNKRTGGYSSRRRGSALLMAWNEVLDDNGLRSLRRSTSQAFVGATTVDWGHS
jgi:hypothetical protein